MLPKMNVNPGESYIVGGREFVVTSIERGFDHLSLRLVSAASIERENQRVRDDVKQYWRSQPIRKRFRHWLSA